MVIPIGLTQDDPFRNRAKPDKEIQKDRALTHTALGSVRTARFARPHHSRSARTFQSSERYSSGRIEPLHRFLPSAVPTLPSLPLDEHISPALLPHVFEMLTQSGEARTRAEGGSEWGWPS